MFKTLERIKKFLQFIFIGELVKQSIILFKRFSNFASQNYNTIPIKYFINLHYEQNGYDNT
jgi:hypothetical protein